ncbi:hypothetical protein [Limnofasciculus baicalensis]|uniref:Uncharacterized protein n=1 Tax=Limnofasciculus baicalensis BBK-W-15 TaxID=2699891 RepID=A0AAE3KPT6_9CYAN|nr:hypothetical protein [Limnofasciculus baicalensis]MCP2730003.1 hypothetical protein [Limnofasciculus baicalensis BBK-W-15]
MITKIASIARKQIVPLSLLVLLGGAGVTWLSVALVQPQTALAYTARVDVSLTSQTDETYENFLRRGEAVARAAAQRSFDGDILVTEVAITIVGEHNGEIAPVLLLSVSRQDWKNRPDAQYWATYFSTSKLLLNFEPPIPPPQATPDTSVAPSEPPLQPQAVPGIPPRLSPTPNSSP